MYTTDPMSGQNGVLTSDFSDHFSIFTIRQNMEPKIPDKYRYKRKFANKNISKLNKQFKKIDWNSTLNTDSVLLAFSCFFALVKDIFDSCFPQKKIKITYSSKNPWITNLLKDEIKQREKIFIKSKRNPSQINIQL